MKPLKRNRPERSCAQEVDNDPLPIMISSPSRRRYRCASMRFIILILKLYVINVQWCGANAFATVPAFTGKQPWLNFERGSMDGGTAWSLTSLLQVRRRSFVLHSSSKTKIDSATSIISDSILSSPQIHRNTTTSFHLNTSYILSLDDADIPKPTANGGYTHTTSSKAKISAANRGKVPWNKGKERSPETRAKIAAGVQARNRRKFLEKLAAMGLTEEEYERKQEEEQERKRQELLKRRTPKGGIIPSNETRAKISRVLKEKFARNEIKRNVTNPRRGFTHSEETKRKIAETLRKRWGNSTTARSRTDSANKTSDYRKKVSETLKKKWEDPEFRAYMMSKMANRTRTASINAEHRRKISEAMKMKWQDPTFRRKAIEANGLSRLSRSRPPPKPKRPKRKKPVVTQRLGQPSTEPKERLRRRALKAMNISTDEAVVKKEKRKKAVKPTTLNKTKTTKGPKRIDGDVFLLKEERRDLFDLLYGDDELSFDLDESTDEELDDFDPYGLENG